MSLEGFDAHLHDPAPGFRCYACGDRSEIPALVASVKNRVGRPGSTDALDAVNKMCGAVSPTLKRFVELHDGVVLYRDDKSAAAGVEFYKATEWEVRTQEMRESMSEMGFEEEQMPDWFQHGVAFGEIPHSANYLVIQISGKEKGQVFYCDHDDFTTEPVANSFEELLGLIINDPPGFLYQRGCYTRYCDGKTDTQWIPKEYVADCRG